jgi:hypothetical protein
VLETSVGQAITAHCQGIVINMNRGLKVEAYQLTRLTFGIPSSNLGMNYSCI